MKSGGIEASDINHGSRPSGWGCCGKSHVAVKTRVTPFDKTPFIKELKDCSDGATPDPNEYICKTHSGAILYRSLRVYPQRVKVNICFARTTLICTGVLKPSRSERKLAFLIAYGTIGMKIDFNLVFETYSVNIDGWRKNKGAFSKLLGWITVITWITHTNFNSPEINWLHYSKNGYVWGILL